MAKASGMFPAGKAGQAGPGEMPRLELFGGGEEPEKWWGLKSPLKKKKKSNSKKDTVTYTHSKPPSSGGRKLSLLSHPHVTHRQIHGPTQLPSYRYETNSCFWGGVGPGKGNSGSGAGNL